MIHSEVEGKLCTIQSEKKHYNFSVIFCYSEKKRKIIQVAKVTKREKLSLFNKIGVHLFIPKLREVKKHFMAIL